jgi:hypothetical protein
MRQDSGEQRGAPGARSAEHARLAESPTSSAPWRAWGPYLAGRQWGTVREDYSASGDAWSYLPFEQAHARAYRWGEDGLGGICDRYGFLNVAIALWNGHDPVLKERLFGLTNGEGNHGEDVKEYWWALDSTPTHSWMRWLYRYPQAEYPYARLREENARRGRDDREFELGDTGVLDGNRFFDVVVTYAKAAPDDICIVLDVTNHGPDPAPLDVLPQIWFRNTWVWGRDGRTPSLRRLDPAKVGAPDVVALEADHDFLGRHVLCAEGSPEVLICENETNAVALFGVDRNPSALTKDGVNNYVVHRDATAVRHDGSGTKAALRYHYDQIGAGETVTIRLRLSQAEPTEDMFGVAYDAVLEDRRAEADEFYASVLPGRLSDEDRLIARRAFAGLLWGKQLYRFSVQQWLEGDPAEPVPPANRWRGRNSAWRHLALADVISMPDEWEYPWFASWDLAFHCVALAHVDASFAKEQLVLLGREWAMHPDGQLPAYEWAFGDVNPPVHAWAAWNVYVVDGSHDVDFLIRICTKLLMNFAWWVNRKDADGSNLFEGGFLGMDNIGFFDRSAPPPPGYRLEQSDATSWMAFFCLGLLRISVELARRVPAWDDVATKFLVHFLDIAQAMQQFGSSNVSLWDEQDGFYYDVLVRPDGTSQPLPVRSIVGLLPLLAVALPPGWVLEELPDFASRLAWLSQRRPDLLGGVLRRTGPDGRQLLLSLVDQGKISRILPRMFDEERFLSPFGIRSLSAAYRQGFTTQIDGASLTIDYEPGESRSGLFGGNSNWRGPIWMPINVLLADALRQYGAFFGTDLRVEVPTGSGVRMTLTEAADEIEQRLIALFRRGPSGRRPSDGARIEASDDPLWAEHVTFSEYFHGDTGEGLGATHQTGWTALVAHLLCRP